MPALTLRALLAVAAFLLTLGPAPFARAQTGTEEQIVDFSPDDPTINAAIAEARHWLDQVFAIAIDDQGRGNPALWLKVSFPFKADDTTTEVIWVGEIMRDDSGFQGKLLNQPAYMPDVSVGDGVRFSEDMIADWSIISTDGTFYGNFTTRVQLPQMSEDEAAQTKAMLSEDPVPASWR